MTWQLPKPAVFLVLLWFCLSGCANIEFEFGPYAIQDVDIIYSIQEDVTFLTWKLREDADLDRVYFEVNEDEVWIPIDLGKTIFPAAPSKCGNSWCFQYQFQGQRSWSTSAVRSVHVDDGYFPAKARFTRTVSKTLSIKPIALADNLTIDPVLEDVLALELLPTRRNFEWELVGTKEQCKGEVFRRGNLTPYATLSDLSWTEQNLCMVVWPPRTDGARVDVRAGIRPSAQTVWEVQTYIPPVEDSPIVYGLLFDLEIPNEARCEQVKEGIASALADTFKGRGTTTLLDIYTPNDTNSGESLSGCEQRAQQDYPIADMMQAARLAARQVAPMDIRVLWIYVNNVNVPPSQRLVEQFLILQNSEGLDFEVFTWGIGTNPVIQAEGLWDITMGWRAIEDDTLLKDIRSVARVNLPFRTMLHDSRTRIPILAPVANVKGVKICTSSPFMIPEIGTVTRPLRIYQTDSDAFVPWTDGVDVFYRLDIEEQQLVPYSSYVRHELLVTLEFCTDFCENPFRSRGGIDFPSWTWPNYRPPMEACQWFE